MHSTVFEWSIDDVSQLNPANVVVDESQFQPVVDPEEDVKQATIRTFFSEKIHVPSPIDSSSLRNKKLILSLNHSFSECRPAPVKSKRDGCCQTELTLPPILPKAVEDALQPFFTFTQSQQQSPSKDCGRTVDAADDDDDEYIDHDARNASLQRKLIYPFAIVDDAEPTENERDLKLDSPAPHTPELELRDIRSQRCLTPYGKHNDGTDVERSPLNISLSPVKQESFGCISPIPSAITPHNSTQSTADKTIQNDSHMNASVFHRSTPERSRNFRALGSGTKSVTKSNGCDMKRKSFHLSDEQNVNLSHVRSSSESNETGDCSFDDDTHISSHSSYGSQQHPHTPTLNKSKRRRLSVNRKNLSLSFNSCVNEENMSVIEHTGAMTLNTRETTLAINGGGDGDGMEMIRIDSGFNETGDLVRPKQYEEARNVGGGGDVSMTDAR